MKLFIFLSTVLYSQLFGQPTLTLSGPANATPGATVTLNLTLSGSSGQNLSGIQWSLAPPAGLTISAPALGAIGSSTGKGIWCNTTVTTCMVVGLNAANVVSNTPLADGIVGTVQATVVNGTAPGVITLPLSGLLAANTSSASVAFTQGTVFSITVGSKCDVNGDGKVDFQDVLAVIQGATGRGACPLSAPSAGNACNVTTVVNVLNAALGGACSLQ